MEASTFISRFSYYNKDILPIRTLFFKDSSIEELDSFIKTLDYDVSIYSKNFRWGQRYFNNLQNSFSWLSSNNGTIKTSFFNRSTHEQITYDKRVTYNSKILEEHMLSHKKTKRKISFYYKLDDSEKNQLEDYSNALTNLYMISKKTYGFSQKVDSDVIWLDLDNHCMIYDDCIQNEAITKLQMIMEKFNITLKDFLYIEANIFTGGIHCAIKLPFKNSKTSVFYQEFERELNQTVNVECNFQTKLLRLPLSFEYLPLKRDIDLTNKTTFSQDDFIPTFKETVSSMCFKPLNPEVFLSNEKKEIKSEIKTKIQNKYWNTPRKLFVRINDEKKINIKKLYTINKEHRWDTFKVLIPYLKLSGKSYEEVLKILQEQNIDSKDMKDFDKLKKDIKKFYDNIRLKSKTFGVYQKYVSNQSFLSEITQEFFNDSDFQRYLTERFIRNYVKVRNYKNNSVSKEKYNILLKQVPYFIKEIIGKMFYIIKHPKKFIDDKFNHYLGFQLSYNHLEKIQEQSIIDLQLEDNPLNKTSLQYLKKALLLTLDIEEIENPIKGHRNWIKGSCKSFKIHSENDINNILKHFYNSCFRDIVTNNFIIKQKKLYTLYISLIENNEICYLEDVNFIKLHIPIPIDT